MPLFVMPSKMTKTNDYLQIDLEKDHYTKLK